MGRGFKLGLLVLVISIIYGYIKLTSVPPVPKLSEPWWGPRDPSKEDTEIRPYQINISENIIKDLYARLENHIPLQKSFEGTNQHYGMNSELLEKIIAYWRTKYNWKERQKLLNQFPQYTVSIQGLKIHYLHVKPKKTSQNVKVLPLLLVHGWPGSVREFYEMIPMLTTPQKDRDFVFEVIVPSLPGYGFSEAAVRPGLGAAQMATIFKNLMKRLGFDEFYIQGGDWGSIIVRNMAILYPENIIGVHSNLCMVDTPLSNLILLTGQFLPSLVATPEEQAIVYPVTNMLYNLVLEMGYMHIQATKPDTAGVAVRDSPVGLAAYILEKFSSWTNLDYKNQTHGSLTEKYTMDQLLDNIMIYWTTRSITTSMRLYAETFNIAQRQLYLELQPIKVPAACARFTHELVYPLETQLKTAYPALLQITSHDGGHFAAFEVPEVLAKDVYEFVSKVEDLRTEKWGNTKNSEL